MVQEIPAWAFFVVPTTHGILSTATLRSVLFVKLTYEKAGYVNQHQCDVSEQIYRHYYLSTHTRHRFTALLDFVQDNPGEQAPER